MLCTRMSTQVLILQQKSLGVRKVKVYSYSVLYCVLLYYYCGVVFVALHPADGMGIFGILPS